LYTKLYQTARDGDSAEKERLQDTVLRIGRGVYSAGGNYLCGLKYALSLAGLCSDVMAEPFQPLPRADREQVRQTLLEIGLLSESVAVNLG
jgi:4-hydroxy-tetrahydrodipicolinate synthase